MIDPESFALSPEQEQFARSIARFLAERCDFATRARRLNDSVGVDPDLWCAFAEMGWLGLEIGEDLGGAGLGAVETLLVMHGFGRELVVEPYLAFIVLGAGIVRLHGDDAQRAWLLPRVVEGVERIALAFAEPQARYNVADVATTAVLEGGGWRIHGHKCMVLGAPAATRLVIPARTRGSPLDEEGVALFMVAPPASGLSMTPYRNVDGSIAADIRLDGVLVNEEACLGAGNNASAALAATLDRAAAAVVADASGAMERCVEMTRDFLKVRTQYDQPLASFQVLRHRLVDMYIASEEARSLAHWAAGAVAGSDPRARMLAVSAAKAHAGECGRTVGQGAVQLHGAMGIVDEYPIGHYLKRLTVADRLFGDRMFHLDRYAELVEEATEPAAATRDP